MSTVDRLRQILTQLRSGLATRTRTSQQPGSAPALGHKSAPASSEQLQVQIRSVLAGLNLNVPQDRHRARRAFVESVLVSEFGANVANDPRFLELVAGVESALSSDESLSNELNLVLDESR